MSIYKTTYSSICRSFAKKCVISEKRVGENWEGYVSPLHSGIVIVFHKYVAEFCTWPAICRNIYLPHSQTVLYTNGSLKHTLRLQHGMLPCCKKKGARKKAQEGEAENAFVVLSVYMININK